MSHTYEVRLYNTNGELQAIFDTWDHLEIEHKVNGVSTHRLDLYGGDSRVDLFTTDSIVEVRRKDDSLGIDWYTEYVGFHRTPQRQLTEGQHDKFISYGRGFLDLIRRRSLMYFAGTGKAGPADDVIKEYVYENAGAGATQPPRLYPGVTAGLSVADNQSAAPEWNGERSWRNLLDTIEEIAAASSVDFDVVWNGGQSFTFQTYYPQLGTDRTAGASKVLFSPLLQNMIAPSYTYSRTEEANVVVVLGQGQEEDRETLLVSSGDDAASPWNYIEETHDARNESEDIGLLSEGQARLKELEAKQSFEFQALQTPQTAYGRHYFLGDIVVAQYKWIVRHIKVVGVSIKVSGGTEAIDIEFGDPQ